jgi:hypothetical protein
MGEIKEYMVPMRDGAGLYTRVFFPEGVGPWPTVLIRDPYGKANPVMAMAARRFADHGYATVLQHVRGTAGSEGEWVPHKNERQDGVDALQWLIGQPWMNGNIGTYGVSYRGYVQLAIADQLPVEVKTMVVGNFGLDRHKQMYQDGMFRLDLITSWAVRNCGINPEAMGELYKKALGIRPHIDMDKELYGVELPWYRELITNVSPIAEFWNSGIWPELLSVPPKVKVPFLFLGGWFDYYLPMMLENYEQLPAPVRAASRFQIFPVAHNFSMPGDLAPFTGSGMSGMVPEELEAVTYALEWFDYQLKGLPYRRPVGVIEAYAIGANKWEPLRNWPPRTETQRLYLAADNVAGDTGGKLCEVADASPETISYCYDPNNPSSAQGADTVFAYLQPAYADYSPMAGPVRQDPPGARPDVLTFMSQSFPAGMLLAGSIKVLLQVASDAEDTAFTVKISEVRADGTAYNIRNTITSLAYRNGMPMPQVYEPGSVVSIGFTLRPIVWQLPVGAKLRLDISSSNFPEYHNHSNTSGPWAEQCAVKIAKQTIYFGGPYASYIEVPVRT